MVTTRAREGSPKEPSAKQYSENSDGRIQWRMGTRETEVRLDGWCEGGLRQQRNDGGGCATMRERSERVESNGTHVTE